jgi:hypothetical protein
MPNVLSLSCSTFIFSFGVSLERFTFSPPLSLLFVFLLRFSPLVGVAGSPTDSVADSLKTFWSTPSWPRVAPPSRSFFLRLSNETRKELALAAPNSYAATALSYYMYLEMDTEDEDVKEKQEI